MPSGVRDRQRDRTREALLREGRHLFAIFGYGAVSLSQIVAATGMTKGALYHHFDSKVDLFRAVLEQVQHEVAGRVVAAAEAGDDLWGQFTAGCQEFLAASTAPEIQRIMLIDGPAVLGWAEWRALDDAASARHLTQALSELIDAGLIISQPVVPLARLLSGAMNEAALWLAGPTRPQDIADTRAALARLLDALRVRTH